MRGFADIHHHLVYDIDDGPKTKDEMFAMLRLANQNDVGAIVATPHYKPGLSPFRADVYRARLEEAREYIAQNALGIEVFEGAELMYVPGITEQFLNNPLPTIADTQYLLVEFYPDISYAKLERAIGELTQRGYVPVLAHFERYRCLMRHSSFVYEIKQKYGALYQVNTGSILHRTFFSAWRNINRYLKEELIDFVATDSHNTDARPCDMKEAYRFLVRSFDRTYADELTGRNGKGRLFGQA